MGKALLIVTFFALIVGYGFQSAAVEPTDFKHFYVYHSARVTKLTPVTVDGQDSLLVDFVNAKGVVQEALTLCRATSRETLKYLPNSTYTLQVVETVMNDHTNSNCISDAYAER